MSRTHELKLDKEYFDAVESGIKTFEYRKNDRCFQKGDVLVLREWDTGTLLYTGRKCKRLVTYVLPVINYLNQQYVILSLADNTKKRCENCIEDYTDKNEEPCISCHVESWYGKWESDGSTEELEREASYE